MTTSLAFTAARSSGAYLVYSRMTNNLGQTDDRWLSRYEYDFNSDAVYSYCVA